MSLLLSAGDHRFLSEGGCAPVTGIYRVDGNRLRFSNVDASSKSCSSSDLERQWFQALQVVTNFEIRGRTLSLFVGDTLIAKLEAVGPKEIK